MMVLRKSVTVHWALGILLAVGALAGWLCAAEPLHKADANAVQSGGTIKLPMEIPIVIVKYFPVDGDKIDVRITGDWDYAVSNRISLVER